jgi:VIT1/CCC1 family predicted Fe2+/Mn2+ transporter
MSPKMKDAVNPYSPPEEPEDHQEFLGKYASKAEVLLGAYKGHLGIINMLRAQGYSIDEAKRLSYPLFDEAKIRLIKSQRPLIFISLLLFFLGVFLPLIMFLIGASFNIFSTFPLIGGVIFWRKVVRPSRLP